MPNYKIDTAVKYRQSGISLVEILLALALAIIILLGATRVFKNLISSSQIQLSNNTMQRTADMAFSHLSFRLRNATAMPCASLQTLQQTGKITIHSLVGGRGGKAISATHQAMITNLLNSTGISIQSQKLTIDGQQLYTDNLTFITARGRFLTNETIDSSTEEIKLTTHFAREPKNFFLPPKNTIHPFLITDCKNVDVFLANVLYAKEKKYYNLKLEIQGQPIFNISYPAHQSIMVSPLNASTISIDKYNNLNDKLIFDKSMGNTLMNDVVLMRILLGVDSVGDDGIIDKYITAKQFQSDVSTGKVISINISLLVQAPSYQRSLNIPDHYTIQLPDTAKSIPNNGKIPMQQIIFRDHILRKVFTKTITLGNLN